MHSPTLLILMTILIGLMSIVMAIHAQVLCGHIGIVDHDVIVVAAPDADLGGHDAEACGDLALAR